MDITEMDLVSRLLSSLTGSPTEITLFITTIVALVTIWLKSREVDVAGVTSISRLQQEQLKTLMEQNAQLSEDISDLRKLTNEQYEVIKELRARVFELEELLAKSI